TDPIFALFGKPRPLRIVGVAADVDDENIVRGPAPTIYQAVPQMGVGGRLFVHAAGDPYALVPAVTRVIREISAEQPVERAATGGYVLARVAEKFVAGVTLPGALPVMGAAAVLIGAAIAASLVPAARASRVDVMQALRSE